MPGAIDKPNVDMFEVFCRRVVNYRRERLQLRYAAALIKIAHLSDALNVPCCKCAATATKRVVLNHPERWGNV